MNRTPANGAPAGAFYAIIISQLSALFMGNGYVIMSSGAMLQLL